MKKFAEIHLKPEVLARYGLPDIAYPLSVSDFKAALADNGELPLEGMLLALQERSSETKAHWQALAPAMDRLAQLLAPQSELELVSVAGDDWWLELGPVDLRGRFVSLQRDDVLLAAIAPREDGRLRVAVYQPLDARCVRILTDMSRVPHPEYGVSMRENNWEYALDCSAQMGQVYASLDGASYLSRWDYGLGIGDDGTEVPVWRAQLCVVPRPVERVATEIGVYYTLHEEPGED